MLAVIQHEKDLFFANAIHELFVRGSIFRCHIPHGLRNGGRQQARIVQRIQWNKENMVMKIGQGRTRRRDAQPGFANPWCTT